MMKRLMRRTVMAGLVMALAGYMLMQPQTAISQETVLMAEGTLESIAGLTAPKRRPGGKTISDNKAIKTDLNSVRLIMADKKEFKFASDGRIKNAAGRYIPLEMLEVPCKVRYTAADGVISEIIVITVIPR